MIENKTFNHEFWKGKRVLITGGTKGLGRSLVHHLNQLGAKIAVVSRTERDLDELRRIYDNVYTIQGDVGDKEAIHRISGQTIAMLEGIDLLINNASTLGPVPLRQLLDTTCEKLQETLEVNLLGPFRLIKSIIPYMRLHEGGMVVNISSDAAKTAYPNWGAYSVSKASLDHMTAIWEEELSDAPIRFISIDPGDMHTQMHMDADPNADTEELLQPNDVAVDLIKFLGGQDFPKVRYTAAEWRDII